MQRTEDLRRAWGENLRRRRQARAVSQRRLERLTGVDQSWISQIESGDKWPSPPIQIRLAAGLKTTVGHLFPPPASVEETAELAGIDPTEAAA